MNDTYDKILRAISRDGKVISKRCTEKYLGSMFSLVTEIMNNLGTESLSDTFFCIIHDIHTLPTCITCGGKVKRDHDKFRTYCSTACMGKNTNFRERFSKVDHNKANEARKKTMVELYGVAYNSQRHEVKELIRARPRLSVENSKKLLLDKEWLDHQYNNLKRTSVDIAADLECDYSTVLDHCRQHGFTIRQHSHTSLPEKEIADFIVSLGIKPETNTRTTITPLELDIVVPSNKLAIEFNGLYWHSSPINSSDNKDRHIRKTLAAEDAGYQLLHIFEDEWINKRSIWESMIRIRLGKATCKVPARNTVIKTVSTTEAREFLTANHLQGFVGGKHVGLYHKDTLVMMATFGKARFGHQGEELLRLCTILNTVVVGGVSKLLKGHPNLISFADRRYSTGNAYGSLITLSHISDPGYYWVDKKNMIRINRLKVQKHKLQNFLGDKFDPSLSEAENMFKAGYRKIYDCGQYVFIRHEDQ